MPFYAPNPNAFPPPPSSQQMFPAPGSPATNDLLQMWGQYRRAAPWLFGAPGGGLFNRVPDQFPQVPGAERGMLQPVADIYSFTKKGLLGVPGTEGAGGRGLGSRGGGLLGGRYNFRDPQSVAQYEKDRGLPPGSIKPVEGQMGTISKLTTQPEMKRMMKQPLTKEGQKTVDDMLAAPTKAQMARPVKQTPEISAKLAAARQARAASEGYRLVEDARAWMSANKGKKPFDSKVLADRYNKMDVDQQEIFSRIMFNDAPWFDR